MPRQKFHYVIVEGDRIVAAFDSRRDARLALRQSARDAFIGLTRKQIGDRWIAAADTEV